MVIPSGHSRTSTYLWLVITFFINAVSTIRLRLSIGCCALIGTNFAPKKETPKTVAICSIPFSIQIATESPDEILFNFKSPAIFFALLYNPQYVIFAPVPPSITAIRSCSVYAILINELNRFSSSISILLSKSFLIFSWCDGNITNCLSQLSATDNFSNTLI